MEKMVEEISMKHSLRNLTPVLVGVLFATTGTWLTAQAENTIRAHMDHSFMIGDKTLPPGDYTFRNVQKEDHQLMTATNTGERKQSADFLVRPTTADHTPRHTELVFRKAGNTEYLVKIFEGGSKDGVEVADTAKDDAQYKRAVEHTEEQK
jgi:hypothetical protein